MNQFKKFVQFACIFMFEVSNMQSRYVDTESTEEGVRCRVFFNIIFGLKQR